jgi:hypothetical protein
MPIVRRTRADLYLSKVDWSRAKTAKQIAAEPDTASIFSTAS